VKIIFSKNLEKSIKNICFLYHLDSLCKLAKRSGPAAYCLMIMKNKNWINAL